MVKLEFKITGERDEDIREYFDGPNCRSVLFEIGEMLRSGYKHGIHPSKNRELTIDEYELMEELYNKFYSILNDYNIEI